MVFSAVCVSAFAVSVGSAAGSITLVLMGNCTPSDLSVTASSFGISKVVLARSLMLISGAVPVSKNKMASSRSFKQIFSLQISALIPLSSVMVSPARRGNSLCCLSNDIRTQPPSGNSICNCGCGVMIACTASVHQSRVSGMATSLLVCDERPRPYSLDDVDGKLSLTHKFGTETPLGALLRTDAANLAGAFS